MALRTRKPTGAVPWPLVLLEGEEKAGKSWAIAQVSASSQVGDTYWLDLGEGAADEYGAVPGAQYSVIDHDGTWRDIMVQLREVRALAQAAHDAKAPPVVLGIDSMTAEWQMLSEWADQRARNSDRGKALLAKDPDAEVPVSPNYWNDANLRHRRLMTMLMTWPGIVVMTARGKWVAEMDKRGNPIPNSRVYKVEGQKGLAYDASVWVRMTREAHPQIIGARSVHAGIRPGDDKPRNCPGFSLEWLIFDVLKCDPHAAHVRDLRPLDATAPDQDDTPAQHQPSPQRAAKSAASRTDWEAELAKAAGDLDALRDLWDRAGAEDPDNTVLAQRIRAAVAKAKAAAEAKPVAAEIVEDQAADEPMADPEQLQCLAIACQPLTATDRDLRLALVSLLIGDRITSFRQLRASEAVAALHAIKVKSGDGTMAELVDAARQTLAEHAEMAGASA